MLTQSALLQTFAEVAAALAGFAALASALGSRRGASPSEFSSLLNSVVRSVVLIFACLLPLVVADYGLSEATVWRTASAVVLGLSWVTGFVLVRTWLRYGVQLTRDMARPSFRFVNAPLDVVVQLALLANVVGIYREYASAFYLTHILAGLGAAAAAFIWFLDAVFSPKSQ